MKIFNVRLRVEIGLVAVLPDEPETATNAKPFNDDPVDKQSEMLNKYLGKVEQIFNRPQFVPGMPGSEGDSASMTRSVNVQAETFEELQAILQKFNQTAKELHAVPDSLLAVHNPNLTPIR